MTNRDSIELWSAVFNLIKTEKKQNETIVVDNIRLSDLASWCTFVVVYSVNCRE